MGYRLAWRFLLGILILKMIAWSIRLVFRVAFFPLRVLIKAPWFILATAAKTLVFTFNIFIRGNGVLKKHKVRKIRSRLERHTRPHVIAFPDGSHQIRRRDVVYVGDKTFVRQQLKVIPSPLSGDQQRRQYQLAAYYRDFPVRNALHA